MPIRNWKEDVFTIPNLLSILRILLIPVYLGYYLNAQSSRDYLIAGSILAFSCMTDGLDGWIARRFQMTSSLGKVIDPLADKLTQFSLALCLSLRYSVMKPLACLIAVKEISQLIGAVILLRKGSALPGAMLPGKICTAALFVSQVILVMFPGIPHPLVRRITMINCLLLITAFTDYLLLFRTTTSSIRQTGI